MQYVFNPERVCAKVFMVDVDENTRLIRDFDFKGGCPGNLNAIKRLTKGMHIDEVIDRFAAGYRKVILHHTDLLENDRKEAQGGRWYGSENQ